MGTGWCLVALFFHLARLIVTAGQAYYPPPSHSYNNPACSLLYIKCVFTAQSNLSFYILGESTVYSSFISPSHSSIIKYCKEGLVRSAVDRNKEMRRINGNILRLSHINKGKMFFDKVVGLAETFVEKMAPHICFLNEANVDRLLSIFKAGLAG